ncbi:MAG: nucleotidyltransferase domain-containing protein, partial [Candidatus Helarchaeota archaeon]
TKTILKNAEIYLFGSALEGQIVAGSDIDVLIVSEVPRKHMKRAELCAKIEETAELPLLSHPFHLHLIDPEQFELWKNLYKLQFLKIEV